MRNALLISISTFILMVLSPSASAHKFYASLMDVSLNKTNQNLEIIHRYTTHDLVNTLTKLTDTNVTIDDEQAFETLLKQYVNARFAIYDSTKQPLELNWVGIESGVHEVVVYQEIIKFSQPSAIWINNQMLHDFYTTQANTVNVEINALKNSNLYTPNEPRHKIVFK